MLQRTTKRSISSFVTFIDDKAEFQESELAALKPTLLVADWNALEVEICIRKRVKFIRYRQSSIIEIERFVNETNAFLFNEDEQFEVLFRPLAMGIVTEVINSAAANASDAKKASGLLVIRMRMIFRSR